MRYRRNRQAGGQYFITINLLNRKSQMLTEHIDILRQAFARVKHKHPFELPAIVVLPEHIHLIMELPAGDDDFARRIMLIKPYFSRHIPQTERISTSRQRKGERGIWQRRYWEHCIRDERDYEHHVQYILGRLVMSEANPNNTMPISSHSIHESPNQPHPHWDEHRVWVQKSPIV